MSAYRRVIFSRPHPSIRVLAMLGRYSGCWSDLNQVEFCMRVCVVGVGNVYASDDGVGPEIVKRLQTDSDAVEFVALRQAGVELLDLMDRCDVLFVVDAVSSGAPAGTVHREEWTADTLASRGVERASSHGLGVREMLDLAAALDRLPARVILWGVEMASTEPKKGLSPAVADAVPAIVARIEHELEGIWSK